MAVSMAHFTADPLLMEEVMIYLAEHGTAPEIVPQSASANPR